MRRWKLLLIPIVGFLVTIFVLSIGFGEEDFIKKGGDKGISFLSGGAGLREREILNEMGKDYPLKMVFSNKMGEFLTDVVVKILDQDENTILITVSNGPWLFVDLPTGIYHLEASVWGGRKRISQVRVEGGSQKVISVQW